MAFLHSAGASNQQDGLDLVAELEDSSFALTSQRCRERTMKGSRHIEIPGGLSCSVEQMVNMLVVNLEEMRANMVSNILNTCAGSLGVSVSRNIQATLP